MASELLYESSPLSEAPREFSPTCHWRHVDPFVGAEAADLPEPVGLASAWWMAKPVIGNTHPGACRPFGMVSAGAYSGAYVTGYGRYALSLDGLPATPDRLFEGRTALGFSHFHHSGTGRIRAYYNYFLVSPYTGDFAGAVGQRSAILSEEAQPGYYKAELDRPEVVAEVTVGERAAYHRYQFASPGGEPRGVRVDLTNGGLRIEGMRTRPGEVEVEIDGGSGRAVGRADMDGILIQFEVLAECGGAACPARLWQGREPRAGTALRMAPAGDEADPEPFGVYFEAPAAAVEPLCLRLTFSLRSADQLRANALREAAPVCFDSVRDDSIWEWERRLGRVRVEGGTEPQRRTFYTALYHSLLKPADCYNENPFRDADGPIFFDLATMWDLYRTQLPLMLTFYRNRGRNLVNALLDIAEREGNFPISYLMERAPERFGRQASALGHVTVMDAFVRGIPGIDWERALRLMAHSINKDVRQQFVGEGLVHPVSHTLDLAYASFLTAQLAGALGHSEMAATFGERAGFWRNAYDPGSAMLIESTFYEGEMWNYAFRLFHDMAGRIGLFPTEEGFVEALDVFFGFAEPPPDWGGTRFEGLNNEPDFETPYAYIYAGRHDRTADVVREVMEQKFAATPGGLPGNDDSGALSSWYVWSALGLFPVAGQDVFLIGTPLFDRASLRLERTFQIRAHRAAPSHRYVISAELNGEPLDRAYLHWRTLAAGGVLDLQMADRPNGWASAPGARPPSHPAPST